MKWILFTAMALIMVVCVIINITDADKAVRLLTFLFASVMPFLLYLWWITFFRKERG